MMHMMYLIAYLWFCFGDFHVIITTIYDADRVAGSIGYDEMIHFTSFPQDITPAAATVLPGSYEWGQFHQTK